MESLVTLFRSHFESDEFWKHHMHQTEPTADKVSYLEVRPDALPLPCLKWSYLSSSVSRSRTTSSSGPSGNPDLPDDQTSSESPFSSLVFQLLKPPGASDSSPLPSSLSRCHLSDLFHWIWIKAERMSDTRERLKCKTEKWGCWVNRHQAGYRVCVYQPLDLMHPRVSTCRMCVTLSPFTQTMDRQPPQQVT